MGKIKFKLSVKELSFEFEGDQETGQRFQNSISKTLNSLTETPNQVIDVEARTIDNNYLLPSSEQNSTKPKRKRGKRAKTNNVNSAEENDNGNLGEKVKRTHRPKGQSARDQIIILIQNGFFAEFRTVGEIQDALSKKGHNFDSGEISPTLLRLTKKDYLVRDDSAGKWQYKIGTVNVPTES